jgi:hypothetical protein
VVFSEAVTGFTSLGRELRGQHRGRHAGRERERQRGDLHGLCHGDDREWHGRGEHPAGAAADLAGNLNLASTSTDNSVTFGAAPASRSTRRCGQVDPTNTAAILFTVVFSEAVTGFHRFRPVASGQHCLAARRPRA